MFPLAHFDWEENFQDLSGWCAMPMTPTPPVLGIDTKMKYVITTDELNTPIIAPESEPFNFNNNLASSEADALKTNWEIPSPLNLDLSDTIISEAGKHTLQETIDIMQPNESEFIYKDDYVYRKMSSEFLFSDPKDDYLRSDCSVPLALVEGKLPEVEVLPVVSPSEEPSLTEDTIDLAPLIESEGFDLLAYVCDDSLKLASENMFAEKNVFTLPKFNASLVIDIPVGPSTSKSEDMCIKTEVISEDEDHDDDDYDIDETYPPRQKGQKNNRGVKRKRDDITLPAKRSRCSISTSSELTTMSASSDSKYRELRDRNNEASKKSRQSRKTRDKDMMDECRGLEIVNRTLKIKAEEMENLVKQLRQSLLETVAKKNK